MRMLTTAEEVSDVAFGFMGSKALFAALHLGVFDALAAGAGTAEQVAARTALAPERARTLLTALAAIGLVGVEGARFANAPAAEAFLVRGARHDFGDYLRFQVDRQMYRLLDQIDAALAGRLPADATGSYADWFADAEAARVYSESQHAGSLGPARGLARGVDLSGCRRLLDVGGGTGAYAITLAEANPALEVAIIDFPTVAAVGRERIAEAGLSARIAYVEGDALAARWPDGQDAVLMSYLLSGVPDHAHAELFARAHGRLVPGGLIMVHDFVVDADRRGPRNAALWQLQHTAFTPEARSIDTAWLEAALGAAGFSGVAIRPVIPGMTMLATARRAA